MRTFFELYNSILLRNKKLIKYIITGAFFTISSSLLFIYLSKYISRTGSIIFIVPVAFFIKFLIYKLWVFTEDSVNIKKFIIHIIPQYLISILIAKTTVNIPRVDYVALILILVNSFIGYFWGNYLYSDKKFFNK